MRIFLLTALSAFLCSLSIAQAPPDSIPRVSTENIAERGFFYVGGDYVGEPGQETMGGAMYVEVMVPKEIKHPYPIVFLHGNGQTGVGYLQTPDGRPGWAYNFLDMGYVVYVQDYPARGRSQYVPGVDGELSIRTGATVERIFTANATRADYPQADKQTQWPGTGLMGDPIMDEYMRSQVQFLSVGQDELAVSANIALLDLINQPVILLTHSQGGRFGWNIADQRPDLVKAIVTSEPAAPPIRGVNTTEVAYRDTGGLPWGVSNLPISYEPRISDPSEFNLELQAQAEGPDLVPCYRQQEPAKQLVNLVDIPVLFLNGEGSYHRIYDHCLANWLNQAGVETEYVRMEEVGLDGNGHMMMLELNSSEIADFIGDWLEINTPE